MVSQESWGQGKSPNEKISNGTNINWPPGEDQIHIGSRLSALWTFSVVTLASEVLLIVSHESSVTVSQQSQDPEDEAD